MNAYLQGIASAVAETVQTNAELATGVEGWTAERIVEKTGITQRHVATAGQTAADLAFCAAQRLLQRTGTAAETIDALMFCTQSPDYVLPTTACLLQERLQLPQTCGAFDVNLGCSGFTYGLWLARSLIVSDSARQVLLLAGDTLSKYVNPRDMATASLFGDGVAAVLVSGERGPAWAEVGVSVVGTNGSGGENLILRAGGCRLPAPETDADRYLQMNGAEIASFAVGTVKRAVDELLSKTGLAWSDIAKFVFHQANPAFIKRLASAYRLPPEKVPVELADVGNTCGATIPMVLERMAERGDLHAGDRVVLVGFGVGYSWAATLLQWLR